MKEAAFRHLDFWENLEDIAYKLQQSDLLIVVSARPHSLSFTKIMERIPRVLSANFETASFVILFPEQDLSREIEGVSQQFVS